MTESRPPYRRNTYGFLAVTILLPFGLDENGSIAHISEVARGAACNCVCPACRSPLIAAKGATRQHHFKHDAIVECEHAFESAIHLAAKRMIREKRQITLSEYILTATARDSRGVEHTEREAVVEHTLARFDFVREEVDLDGMTPDLLAVTGGRRLLIEIFYRHKVDDEKRMKIANNGVSAIEIDLSNLTPQDLLDWEALWSRINDAERVQWLYHARTPAVYQRLQERLAEAIEHAEQQYRRDRLSREVKERKEQAELLRALIELKNVSGRAYIEQLNKTAETHAAWKHHKRYLPFSWDDPPDFLDADVPNGDWIFGCDRRVWQTAFYGYFIRTNGKPFSIRSVDTWLQNTAGCKVPSCVKTVAVYGRRYPNLLPADFSGDFPSTWKPLNAYFRQLCSLGLLEFSGRDRGVPGNYWFNVVGRDAGRRVLQNI